MNDNNGIEAMAGSHSYNIKAVEKRNIQTEQVPGMMFHQSTKLTVVLVQGEAEDYAAYIGCGSDQWVAGHGDKLSFGEAQGWFSFIEEKNYRR